MVSFIYFGVVQPTLSDNKPFSRSFNGRNLTYTLIKSLLDGKIGASDAVSTFSFISFSSFSVFFFDLNVLLPFGGEVFNGS